MVTATDGLTEPLRAARHVGFPADVSTRVELLEGGEKTSVYRLSLPTSPLGSCIVKRCSTDRHELAFYRDLAPRLQVATLHWYGSYEDGEGSNWLVLEDAGDWEPSIESPGTRALLTEWAAALHRQGSSLARESLPDAGPERFRFRLRDTGRLLARRLELEELDADEREALDQCLERCLELDDLWPWVEEVCARYRPTVVHGDLVEENLRLRGEASRETLVALDWEKVGWGVPAVDLVRVEPDRYWSSMHAWLGGSRTEFDQLVLVGSIFRVLVHRFADKSVRKAQKAEKRLRRLIATVTEK